MHLFHLGIFLLFSIPSLCYMVLGGMEIYAHRKNTNLEQGVISDKLFWSGLFVVMFYMAMLLSVLEFSSVFSTLLAFFFICETMLTSIVLSLAFMLIHKNSRRISKFFDILIIVIECVLFFVSFILFIFIYLNQQMWQ